MSEPSLSIRAFRFVYGKVVETPGGPVEPGFEHRPTSISTGLPEDLIPSCRPEKLLANRSVQALVHPQRRVQGAQLFWPAVAEGRRWMLATCVRARPESGEGAISRTYTQLATYCFSESDWCRHAPRLIANAGQWLRAEPDTRVVYESEGRPETVLDEAGLPEVPPCEHNPLPKSGTLLWRLAAAIEGANTQFVCGPADGVQTEATFLRALACVAALLPEELRIYLTAGVGLAEPHEAFALQFLPEAPPLPKDPPGLLAQMAGELVQRDPSATPTDLNWFWLANKEIRQPDDGHREAAHRLRTWDTPAEARRALADLLDRIAAARSADDLRAWLDGRRPDCPSLPALHQRQTGASWISALTGHIRYCLTDKSKSGLDRAIVRLATLIPADASVQEVLGQFWSEAWRRAAENGGEPIEIRQGPTRVRPVLCWSTLVGSDAADDPSAGIGRLRDFAELSAITLAVRLARERAPDQANAVAASLGNRAFKARLDELRRRGDRVLAVHPETVIDLAQSMPALLAPRRGEDLVRTKAAGDVLEAIALAARLRLHSNGGDNQRGHLLLDSAEQVQAAMHRPGAGDQAQQQSKPDTLALLLRCFWRQTLAPKDERPDGDTLWPDAVSTFVGLWAQQKEGGDALRCLFGSIPPTYHELRRDKADGGWVKRNDETDKKVQGLADACLTKATDHMGDPAQRAVFALRGLPDLTGLAVDPNRPIGYPLSLAWRQHIDRELKDPNGDTDRLAGEFLPLFVQGLAGFLERITEREPGALIYKENPRPMHLKAVLEIEVMLLVRLAGTGAPPPRRPVLELIKKTQALINRVSGFQQDERLSTLINQVAVALALCVTRWAESRPPEPRLDGRGSLLRAPIRLALAKRLGFPMAAYFGHLTTATYETPENKQLQALSEQGLRIPAAESLGLTPGADRSLGLVIAPGAANAWRGLFDSGPRGIGTIRRMMQAGASAEALDALALVLRRDPPGYDRLIDPDTRFVIGFFLALGSDESPFATMPMSSDLEKALLSNGKLHDSCYAIALARAIATLSTWGAAHDLARLFTQRERNSRLAKRVMGLSEHGWAGFPALDDSARRRALLRLLFLLSIVVADWVQDQTWRLKVQDADLKATLQLAPANPEVKEAMDRFLERHTDLAEALRSSATPTRIPLPGWPLRPD